MYLKEVKVSGFKSFADKLNIEFNDGITCIVGPNGSGKSNVVDAVRWVLGEQSVKSLRGEGSMSDVIFSGSKSRNSLSVASVTLVFDNSDKHLPLDYSEVSIKRRVYTNGENEYFLNGEKCRLKDIVDLFIDSGIGRESFNIISQGEVQKIIGTKPEDRRTIFEEAAGVLKYKKRKEEALRKLEKTHDNINRVNDIINELAIQVEPLKEQSIKASEYLEKRQELENVEIALITYDIDNINYEYQYAKIEIEKLNEELLSLNTSNSSNQAEVEKEKNELQKLDKELFDNQKRLAELSSEVEKLNGQKQMINERQKYNANDIKMHNNIIHLKENELKLNNDIYSVETDINSSRKELIELNKNMTNVDNELLTIKKAKDQVINQLDLTSRKERELNHKIEILRESIENNSNLSQGARNVLNSPKLTNIHGVIGKLIEMDEKHATAIDISLGAAKEFIVVDNENNAKDAINYLKNNNLGRATFFPLNVITPKGIDEDTLKKIANHISFIDTAANLVKYDPKYRNVILNQLGNVIIACDIDGANQLSKIINHRYKIVTLDGDLIHIGGSMTGGSIKKTGSMIKEKYELEEMLRQLTNTTNECQNLENKINELDYNYKNIEQKIYSLKTEKINIEELINNKLNTLNNNKQKQEQIHNELTSLEKLASNSITEEENRVMNQYYDSLKDKEEASKIVENLNKKRQLLYSVLEEKETSIKKSNHNYNKKQEEIKNLEIKVNRMDVKLDNLLNVLNEEYNMTFEKAKEKYKLDINVDDARIKVNNIKAKIKTLGMVNLGAIEEYERVNKRFTFLNTQKEDLIKAENTLLDIIKEMDAIMQDNFIETFNVIKEEFKKVFRILFGGGEAELKLTDPSNILETGIEIIASPPGKKLQHLTLLSGGEKTLTAISLLFAILNARNVPFCLFDEVEAALDEVNVVTFGKYLQTYRGKTQFVIITHKKKTMEFADILYGITMQESGVSKLVSVKLEDVKEVELI
jgi:chromosome segregation protein